MKIKRAAVKDLPNILNLLKECELPVQGVADNLRKFMVLKDKERIIGCIGLEMVENCCLLRSLAVTESERGKGYGRLLVERALKTAKEKNIKKVYLLTTDGADYFRRFNFRIINRNKVDPEIQKTFQFTSLCCRSALCLFKSIH